MVKAVIIVLWIVLLISGFVALDLTYLDPSGEGFTGEANAKCVNHGGVKEMNAYQGFVICWDGEAR